MSALLPRRRRWWTVGAVVLALLAGVVWWAAAGGDEDPGPARGPDGAAFYAPDEDLVAEGEHGSLIWSRRVVEGPTIGGTTHLVLYRSTSAKGETVPVSGVVSVPEGDPPEGGWPVISWGHGTTGMADDCAPSRSLVDEQTGVYTASMERTTAGLLEEGHAVVRTDYEGLGTPGPHPYLMGQSAGAAMTDIVLAAREVAPDLSSRWLAMGHSQGGQAALFTSRFTGAYAPGLDLLGIVALAPPSQLGPVVEMTGSDRPPASGRGEAVGREQPDGGATFIGPLLVAAARTADVPVEEVVSPRGRELLPQLEERCIAELFGEDSFGGIPVDEFVADGADVERLRRTVGTNDAAELHPSAPVLLVHGAEDTTVPPLLSERLTEQYRGRGADITHVSVAGADHIAVLEESAPDVRAWVEEAFAG